MALFFEIVADTYYFCKNKFTNSAQTYIRHILFFSRADYIVALVHYCGNIGGNDFAGRSFLSPGQGGKELLQLQDSEVSLHASRFRQKGVAHCWFQR